MSFSIIMIKIINYVQILVQNNENDIKIIHSYNQVLPFFIKHSVILAVSALLGTIFAVIFSLIDFENVSNNYLFKLQFLKEQNYCVPIGLGFGCLTGYINEYMRSEVK